MAPQSPLGEGKVPLCKCSLGLGAKERREPALRPSLMTLPHPLLSFLQNSTQRRGIPGGSRHCTRL